MLLRWVSKNQYVSFAVGILLLFAFLDAWNFLSARFLSTPGTFLKFSSIFRIIFEFLSVCVLWKNGFKCKKVFYNLFVVTILLSSTSLIGFLLFTQNFSENIPITNFFICLNKYLYFFIAYYFLTIVFDKSADEEKRIIFKTYEFILFTNTLFAFVGSLGNVWWLRAYSDSNRWGYQGVFTFGVESSFFCVLALFYGIVVWFESGRKMPYFAAILLCILSGAKASWALMIVINCWFLWKSHPKAGKLILFVFILGIFLFAIPMIEWLSEVPAIAFFFELYEKGYPIEKIIFSSRNELIDQAFLNVEFWGKLNYLFGGGGLVTWGIGLPKGMVLITEMDLFDVPLFFGLLGTTIYLIGYYQIFRLIDGFYRILFLVCFFALACLGGHVFNSSMNSLYFGLVLLKMKCSIRNLKKSK